MSTNPLEFATMEELEDEIVRRSDAVLIIREMVTKNDPAKDDTYARFSGGLNRAIGLATRFQAFLLRKASSFADPGDGSHP